ncbi:S-layer homology domain-containing protein [Paenibacillus psychroresistens]|uniref:S-layer homology domain-containing protein n=1 Tax=Paenibacillus psychroresistens TaxID=1778678 RepID=A0A6B8RRM1_9BACL|nr:S-layer homology domain-containing protein [Paenibacillus psychroresistens]QGQ98036.1 S-layer homology domain-containing protein [Paenibacillus psychroresistens]
MKLLKPISVISLTTALLLSTVSPILAAGGAALPKPSINSGPQAINSNSTPSVTDSTYADEAKISKEKAIELAKLYVEIPSSYVLQNISFNSNSYSNGSSLWNLQYGKKTDDKYYGSISVGIDSDSGKLMNYYYNDENPANKPAYPPKVNLKTAKELATELLKKFNPNELSHLQYNDNFEKLFKAPLNGDVRYSIQFDRIENNIPYPNNYVTFTLDGNGKLVSYDQNWSNKVTFADASKAISVEQATYAFQTNSTVALTYISPWNQTAPKKTNPYLSYSLITNSVDALTSKVTNQYGSTISLNTTPLTEQPLADKPTGNLNLTKDQAIKLATGYIHLPANAELENAFYQESVAPDEGVSNDAVASSKRVIIGGGGGTGISIWNLSWQVAAEKGKDPDYISAGINSKTGELLSYYRNQKQPIPIDDSTTTPAATKINLDKAKAAAIDFIKKVVPQYTNELAIDEQNLANLTDELMKTAPAININFRRVVQGILTESESINVGVDTDTGEINSFWSNLSTLEYPTTKPMVLSEADAITKLLSQYNIELTYSIPYDPNPVNPPSPEVEATQEAKPYYILTPKYPDQFIFLDAVSGEWKKRDTGEITTLEKAIVTDIEGHWGQNEIQLMIDYSALDVKDGKVLPDQAITRGEMIKMLVISMNGGSGFGGREYTNRVSSFKDVSNDSTYFPYIESAVDSNIIDANTSATFNPNGTISRDEIAQLIVRALGYDKLAEYSDIFKLDLKDAAKINHKGQVAIVVGLGILTATNGSFMPAQEVTRAQAAIAFSRYLQKRSILQDVPLSMNVGIAKG